MDKDRLCRTLVCGFCLLWASGCATVEPPAPPTPQVVRTPVAAQANTSASQQTIPDAPDRADILATIDRFFEALAGRDADVLETLFSEQAMDVTTYPERDGQPVRYGKAGDVVAAIRAGELPKIEEPYWNPIVLQRKTLAVVWTPYEVWVDETLSHCGIDVFNLTRQNGAWIIDSIHWTTEPSACEELWPDGRSQLRPEMFSKGM